MLIWRSTVYASVYDEVEGFVYGDDESNVGYAVGSDLTIMGIVRHCYGGQATGYAYDLDVEQTIFDGSLGSDGFCCDCALETRKRDTSTTCQVADHRVADQKGSAA